MRAIQFLLLPLMFSMVLIGSARANHEEEEDPVCNSRQAFIEELGSEYGESILFLGLVNTYKGIELYVNKETGSWTLFNTNFQGRSCVIDTGYIYNIYQLSE